MRRLAALALTGAMMIPTVASPAAVLAVDGIVCLSVSSSGPLPSDLGAFADQLSDGTLRVLGVVPCPGGTTTPGTTAGGFGDGTWIVGADIQPGTYRTSSPGGCYWERVADFSGDSTIENDFTLDPGPQIVTIAPSDAGFTSRGCGTWTKV